jgi:hypothetical protein
MWMWRARETRPADPILSPRIPERVQIPSSPERRRLFMVASALITRGMDPGEAYKTALYYTEGPGRTQPWVHALAEVNCIDSEQ